MAVTVLQRLDEPVSGEGTGEPCGNVGDLDLVCVDLGLAEHGYQAVAALPAGVDA
jgi:hypothetical protein